ncbi:MAG: glutaredoxin family protein [Propionibacteriaceae bacterium]|nr:glutaredoxin family protein [Propionibacteriaceae bacterium]
MARVEFITRAGCHLCDEAREVVSSVCGSLGVPWQARDVDTDPELAARYSDHVPVIVIDGDVVSYWFVDADQLRKTL